MNLQPKTLVAVTWFGRTWNEFGESVPVPHIDKRGRILSRGYDTEGKPIPTCDASGGYLVAMLGMGGLVIRAEASEMVVLPEDAI